MSRFCLDANVLIQAKNGPYPFDVFPSFWNWLDGQFQAGIVYSSIFVYEELVKYDDELAKWVQQRKAHFVEPEESIQRKYAEIINFVQQNNNSEAEAEKFLSGADPWVIAHSIVSVNRIVTHEKRVPNNSKKIKIPNICEVFDAPVCLDTYQLMRALGATL